MGYRTEWCPSGNGAKEKKNRKGERKKNNTIRPAPNNLFKYYGDFRKTVVSGHAVGNEHRGNWLKSEHDSKMNNGVM